MDTAKFKTVGEWYEVSKREGFAVPLQMCHALQTLMEKHRISFHQAFDMLMKKDKVALEGKTYIFDLSGKDL